MNLTNDLQIGINIDFQEGHPEQSSVDFRKQMNHKKRKRHATIAWVIISILAITSMVAFLLAPLLTTH